MKRTFTVLASAVVFLGSSLAATAAVAGGPGSGTEILDIDSSTQILDIDSSKTILDIDSTTLILDIDGG